jgi:hypothetical protein
MVTPGQESALGTTDNGFTLDQLVFAEISQYAVQDGALLAGEPWPGPSGSRWPPGRRPAGRNLPSGPRDNFLSMKIMYAVALIFHKFLFFGLNSIIKTKSR